METEEDAKCRLCANWRSHGSICTVLGRKTKPGYSCKQFEERADFDLISARAQAAKIAGQLRYGGAVIEKLQHAETENEISRILVQARKSKVWPGVDEYEYMHGDD